MAVEGKEARLASVRLYHQALLMASTAEGWLG